MKRKNQRGTAGEAAAMPTQELAPQPARKKGLRGSGEKGSVMVETSLTLLVFTVIVIGTLDFSHLLFVHQTLGERVRAALRYSTVHAYDVTATQNIVLYGQPNGGTQPSFNLTRDMVSVARYDAGSADDRVVVTVQNYPVEFITPFMARTVPGRPIRNSLPYEYQASQ
ncbi:MAG: pilus assembly protein [Acidobacteria bacterium]|nr:pilus assembly protein [Acidobacteriota bacterium]MBI3282113.1 pilus assembly protein [Acidobacteriota bacterium]